MFKKNETVKLNKVIPRVEAPTESGLSKAQVHDRLENGYANSKPISAEKTFAQILKSNIFTYFNLIFAILALCVILVGSYNNLTFMPIIITNIIIGIVQEVRSRRALAKLTFVSAQTATVIRDRKKQTIPAEKTVLDDIVVFKTDNQIYADAIVMSGQCNVNEALVTGEADEIVKFPGDVLLSGSFVVSGEVYARLDKVGSDSFVAQLTLANKKSGRKRHGDRSEDDIGSVY
jgi:cation-transporting ATPase E